jgi:hypothetical protein
MLSRHLSSLALALMLSTLALILVGAASFSALLGILAGIVTALTLITAAVAWTYQRRLIRPIAAGCVLAVLALGASGAILADSPWASVIHACLGHAFFAGTVALWIVASWQGTPSTTEDTGSPSLRTLGMLVPPAVLLQIFLGAIYRHVDLPVWPHLTGSLIVGCLLLYTGMVVLESDPPVPALRPVAQALLVITGVQIALGLAAFLGRVMAADHLSPEWWMMAARTAHVVTGALTLGAAVAYAFQVFHHIQPRAERHRIGKSVVA